MHYTAAIERHGITRYIVLRDKPTVGEKIKCGSGSQWTVIHVSEARR